MSKRRHRSRPQQEEQNNMGQNNMNQNNNPFGINPTQLLSMLGGNFDMGGLNNMLSSMNMDGFDLGNLNLGNLQNMFSGMPGMQGNNQQMGNINLGNLGNLNDFSGGFNQDGFNAGGFNNGGFTGEDENIQMLMAIKAIVDPRRASFIDKVIQKYNEGMFND